MPFSSGWIKVLQISRQRFDMTIIVFTWPFYLKTHSNILPEITDRHKPCFTSYAFQLPGNSAILGMRYQKRA